MDPPLQYLLRFIPPAVAGNGLINSKIVKIIISQFDEFIIGCSSAVFLHVSPGLLIFPLTASRLSVSNH